MYSKRVLISLSLIFVLISFCIYFLLEFEKDDKIDKEIDMQLKKYSTAYNSFYHQYKERADLIFETKIDKIEVKEVFKDAFDSSDINKQKLRDELYFILNDDYEKLKKYFLKQLHFYLPNNDNFLSLNNPKESVENKSATKLLLNYVNKNKKFIDSYEDGDTDSGYSFVYPLFYEDRYIGSVKFIFDTNAILNDFKEHFDANTKFLKNISEEKAIKDEVDRDNKIISDESSSFIAKNILLGKNFARFDEKTKKLLIFLPLQNSISKKIVAGILIEGDSSYIQNKILYFKILALTLVVFLGIIFCVVYFEITTKQKLKENSKKLKAVIEEADSGIAILDLKGNFLEVNHVYTKLLGYTSEEFKNINCADLILKELKYISLDALKEAKVKGNVSKLRQICIAKDGSRVHLEMSLNLLPNKKSFVAIINSLDDKIELENLLNRFEHIFNFTSVGFLILNENREVIEVNPKFLKMIGYSSKDELIGKSTSTFHVDKKHFEKYGELIYSKALLNENVRIEYEFKKKDGSRIWLELSGSPLNDNAKLEDGSILWAVVDVTEKVLAQNMITKQNVQLQTLNKNLNDEVKSQIEKIREKDMILIQQSKMASMGEMMDAVAHQWKQPLVLVKLTTDEIEYMIEDKSINTDYLKGANKRIKDQVNHMVETLSEFREFFRPKGDLESIGLKKVIDSALVLMKDELVKYTIVTRFIGDENIKVNVIPNEFKHIIINLVNNAKDEFVKKGIKNRLITFDVQKEDIFVILKVQDNAGGIPYQIIDDIFKANITTKSEEKGSGIGLYMTKNIIEKIGGSIEVSNVKDGAEFIIRIPV